mgnify:FL=1
MFINNLDPVAISLFSFEIKWYSLSYIFGIILGWLYCKKKLLNNNKIFENFDDLLGYIIIGIVAGGRIGYVLFYNLLYYIKNPLEIFMVWHGGMSFHGGLIGVLFATYIFSKKKKINQFLFLDAISMVAPIGLFLGRIANFINSELYGRPTDVFWSVKFIKIDNLSRHPSQIYEAIFEGIVLFFLLNLIFKKFYIKGPGLISALFLIFYSLFRFFIEFTREPDVQIGFVLFNFSLGQILSIIMFFVGIILFYKKNEI